MNDNYKIKVGTTLSQNRSDVHTRPYSQWVDFNLALHGEYDFTQDIEEQDTLFDMDKMGWICVLGKTDWILP